MAEVVFAVFDENLIHLKIVRMNDVLCGGETRIRLEGCDTSTSRTRSMVIAASKEPQPTLTRIMLESGNTIYLWRTPMCVYHRRTGKWIYILDSNCLNAIPGEFTYREECISRLFRGSRNRDCKMLHYRMLEIIRAEQTQIRVPVPTAPAFARTPTAPLAPVPAVKIPAFVGGIIKRDAVRNKDSCAITMDEFTEDTKTMVTPCFHIFTTSGLCKWLESKELCPTCKASIDMRSCLFI
jgi:hypothetical protein